MGTSGVYGLAKLPSLEAMLLPMFSLVLPVELGVARHVPGLSEHSLMMLSHVVMIGGMVVLMIFRWDRYAHAAHYRRT